MDLSPMTLAKVLLPVTPILLKTAVLNTLSLSLNAGKQDLRTELTVSVLRELLKKPNPIGKTQRGSLRDPGIKGKMWISKITLPRPEDHEGITPRDALDMAIKDLGDGSETYTLPGTSAVEAEWTGYRNGVDSDAPRPDLSEEEQYRQLMSEVRSKVTVLYFHGGVYVAMDPASHRLPVSYLAKLTSGRCLSVRYRLAPQHPFPTAILDGLIAYLSLLSPTPDSYHTAVSPSNIVFAGDSAGGNLCLSLCQTLLTLQRKGIRTIRFHGRDVTLSLPTGIALNSPWCDISRAMPSCHTNATYDYLIPPPDFGLAADLPADDIWPTQPPRVDMYVNATALIHPLVSPIAAKPELWRGAPPTYMCAGTEALEDEIAVVARHMDEAGVYVQFDTYEGMPHCFGMIFPKSPMGRECIKSLGEFILEAGDVGILDKGRGRRRGRPVRRWLSKIRL
ncbi:hypothetical protein GJ744_003852 [Endocarpon pusillum]|uniref:Alpha/beta hydrolase fold-3 domain-containing protein n=1 Tax=Endocarpon pusillum TaxID=364733 RepID=A0A8H7E5Y3_9EURO|nr:hypothetical protein GJ744_003852 [Endocarpon pusillum]